MSSNRDLLRLVVLLCACHEIIITIISHRYLKSGAGRLTNHLTYNYSLAFKILYLIIIIAINARVVQ